MQKNIAPRKINFWWAIVFWPQVFFNKHIVIIYLFTPRITGCSKGFLTTQKYAKVFRFQNFRQFFKTPATTAF